MSSDLIKTIFIGILILVGLGILLRNFYMAWFRPSKFLESARSGVKDWWPLADYFRSYYGSSRWLWTNRITSTIFIFVILFAVYQAILLRFHVQP